jgi:glutamine synthetase
VYSDLYGVQRGKDVLLTRAAHAISHGKPFVEAVMTIDHRHNIVSGEEAGFRDFVAIPDLKTARIHPLDPEVAVVLCDLESVPSHKPSGLDPRGSLKRINERYAALGYTAVVAHELEFYLLERHADGVGGMRPLPMRDSSVYTVGPLADPTGLVRGMFEACEEFGLEPISMAQEYGHSQHEINLTHGPAVEATDRAFRIGQLRTVTVHKMISEGTLEERIDQMIEQKTELASQIIGSGEQWLTELNTSQLRDLLALRGSSLEDSQ